MKYIFTAVLTCTFLLASAATAEVVELANGDQLTVTVVEQNDEFVIVEHPLLGQMALPVAQVAAIHAEKPELPVTEAASATAPATVVDQADAADEEAYKEPEVFGVPFLPGWERRFEAGLNGSEGNSETFNFRAAFTGDFEDTDDRWHLGAAYARSTTDGDKTRNDFFAEAIKDWLIPDKKHFYFAQTRYDYDDFQSWQHRAAAAGGVGYQFIEEEKFDLIGRLGGGASYTWGGGGGSELTPEGLVGIEGKWKIKDDHYFEFKNTLYPDLGEMGEFRNVTSLAYVINLNHGKNLALKLGLDNEYESETDDTSDHNDLTYYAALVFDF